MEQNDWKSLEPTHEVKVFLTVLYCLILSLGIVGNSVTIHVAQVLQRNGYLQKNVTDHMVSLACSDLLVLLIGMPVELYSAIWFPFSSSSGDAACRIYNFLFEACSYATILNVATLSFERYMAICHPFRYKALGGSRTTKLLLVAWLCSALVALPLLIATGTEGHVPEGLRTPVQNLTFCTNLSKHWAMYRTSIFTAFVLYLLVLVGVALMCRAMIVVLRGPMGPNESGTNGAGRDVPKHESARLKASRKQSILFLVLIVCALFVCWMPNQIRRLMTAALPKSSWTTSYLKHYVKLHLVADSFFYLSSVLNPLLYNLSSRQFRSAFWQTLQCRLSLEHVNRRTLESSRVSKSSSNTIRPLLRRSLNRIRTVASDRSTTPSTEEGQSAPNPTERQPASSEPQEEERTQATTLPDTN
ncbi:G-protein coupled receptor 39 [Pimephales promelas]|uniref:G-protein coupled receptor 39 n=1 Tax=Pimephales promelas TaxID=90988 RepID=UPI0019559129|nr:G-protein coupled receptor 39 [Pimephales promelas]KAG1944969.1 G-protein coupled receptor [Pimephales promelas]